MALCNPAGGKCNQEEGHEGDHGIAVAGGFVIAPWPNVGPTMVERIVELGCDICGEPMRMAKGADGGTLSCTSATCDQSCTFQRSGEWSYVIIGKLFPSRYTSGLDMPPDMRKDFVAYKLKMAYFYTDAMLVLDLIDQAERERQRIVAETGVNEFWEEVTKREEGKR